MKRFRWLGKVWSEANLFREFPQLRARKDEHDRIKALRVGDGVALIPGSATKAYMLTRVK